MHATICDCFTDAVQNAIEAGALAIEAAIKEDGKTVGMVIKDNGKGMCAEVRRRVWDPFYSEPDKHPGRRVGLGLPLLRQMAEAAGGTIILDSEPGQGTTLECSFAADHLDTPPLGDVPGTATVLMNTDGDFELLFTRTRGTKTYAVRRSELQEALGDLRDVENIILMRRFFRDQEADL